MKRNLLVLAVITCIAGGFAFGQQDKLLTHFMYDKMSFNPGKTGIDQGICGTLIYRNQWDRVNGAPNSTVFNLEGNFNQYGLPGGVGISFYNDVIGFSTQNTVTLNYSYHLPVGDIGELGIGVGLGITNFGMDPTWEPPTTLNDPTLPVGFASTKFDANFGLYLKGNTGWYAGISSTHLPAATYDDETQSNDYNSVRHYYVTGGYRLQDLGSGGKDAIQFDVLGRSDVVKYSADIAARYYWQDKLYGGLAFRTSDALGIMIGANLENMINIPNVLGDGSGKLVLGYSYDATIFNELSSVSIGSHEVMLRYCAFLPPIPVQKSRHVRWL